MPTIAIQNIDVCISSAILTFSNEIFPIFDFK
jgi:hypothetical protein